MSPAPAQKYKKYILFQWDSYDAAGGLNDIAGSFDSLREAQERANQGHYDYSEVADRDTLEIVWIKI